MSRLPLSSTDVDKHIASMLLSMTGFVKLYRELEDVGYVGPHLEGRDRALRNISYATEQLLHARKSMNAAKESLERPIGSNY